VSAREKEEHVEHVIALLNMESFADAIVGVPGKGLNVEQRKLLTIGVELAAKPQLLLFLDEPTSGLDSQSSWAICTVLRKLANSGQAILCTIHQPSAILFEQFDRLLFLRKGGQTVYFGDVGPNSRTLLDYFERNGGRTCDDTENPAEYMLEVANQKEIDWHKIWTESQEAKDLDSEILRISRRVLTTSETPVPESFTTNEFAMPFGVQLKEVTYRTFQQYWRTPGYLTAKFALCIFAGLFIGFSFYDADASQQGMQNVLFSAFMLCIMFTPLVQQILPVFVDQRALYEARERPSKAYSWKAFFIANVVVELPYQVVASIIVYATLLYPIVGIPDGDSQGTVVLFCIVFFVYVSTFGMLCIAGIPDAQTAGAIVTLLFAMSLTFNGIMQPPAALPGFWIWMWRVSPFTYWISGTVSTMLHGRPVQCADAEFSIFDPPLSQTCGEYLSRHISTVGGVLNNPNATSSCQLCSLTVADQFLAGDRIFYSERWRNFGVYCVSHAMVFGSLLINTDHTYISQAYIIFNVVAAGFIYWFFRVRPIRGQKIDAVGSKKGKSASG
jgi:ABC-type multidrug transport system permease subunit/energy-coupling factor transporter ATP-binding protein EcfA2